MTRVHPLLISSPEAATLLCQPEVACLLKPFMRGEKTVGEAAAELGLPLGSLHYRVIRFCQAGLLEMVRERSRRGRAAKLYRATATSFRIPVELLRDELLDALGRGRHWEREVEQQMQRLAPLAALQDVTVTLSAKGNLDWSLNAADTIAPEEQPAGLLRLRSAALFLDPEDAENFAADLWALHERYQGQRGKKRYGLRLDLVPLERPVDPNT